MKASRNIDIALLSLLLTFKIFHTFSKYSIFEFREVLPVGFTREIKVQTGRNYETCKARCILCHINQTSQTTAWKETCIEFEIYAKCRLSAECRFSIQNNFFTGKKP